jgi:transcriptional regulator with XRE-family HTH domain
MAVMKGFGTRLKYLRDLSGLSARALDRLAKAPRGYTSLIETGERPKIGADVAEGYAEALGASLDWLISGHGKPPSKETVRSAVARAGRAA